MVDTLYSCVLYTTINMNDYLIKQFNSRNRDLVPHNKIAYKMDNVV